MAEFRAETIGRRVPMPPTVSCSVAAVIPWPKVKLGEICEIYDCPHTTAPDEGEGYPLVRTPNVGRGRLIFDKMHRVSRAVYDRRNKRAVPKAGDIFLPMYATTFLRDAYRKFRTKAPSFLYAFRQQEFLVFVMSRSESVRLHQNRQAVSCFCWEGHY